MWRSAVIAALAFGLAASPLAASPLAASTHWVVAPEESRIVFRYEADGEPAEGVFARFSGEGTFDPAAPGEAALELRIKSASIDLGDPKADAVATSAEWFDSANYPDIVYRLRDLTHLEGSRYRAEGELTIRSRTRPVTTTIELEIGEKEARASGTLDINRKDYLLGVGPLSLFVDIGPKVAVHFELVAHPAT